MGDHIETATSQATSEALGKTNDPNGIVAGTSAKSGLDQQTLIDRTVDSLLTPPKSIYDDFPIKLVDRYIDEPRELRVAVVGAGLSGVLAGILLPAKVPGIKLTVYEKNADVGGTWFENIYPGVRCDVPAHVYQSTFDPNTQWTEEFAQGAEIRNYWQGLARKYDVYKYLQLSQRVEGLNWVESRSIWQITIRDLKTDAIRIEEAEFVLTAIGRFNAWKLPDYPGLKDFKGVLRHASNWDPNFDPRDKKVAVIGNGASGIQLTSNLHKVVSHLDHYARNKTWITASFAGDETSIEPIPIPEDLRETFRKDPEAYLQYRKENESKYFRHFTGWLKGSAENDEAREKFRKFMNDRLNKKPELIDALIPEFSPHCRRLTPGPGYLEAITSEKTDYIQTRIKRITETGIETEDGKHREVDAIFCATGANVDMVPPFPITAKGQDLTQLWRPDGPYTYFGSATPGFPNLLFIHGPNGSGRSGTVPHNVENQITYFARILRKASREGIKSIQPTKKAADNFTQYSDAFFATTVLSENCSSWYNSGKAGSRIHGLWPGSATLATIVQREPRWEDFEYEYVGDSENPFLWYFGKGCTKQELDPEADVTPYLKAGGVDVKDVHESWWSVP
ncbi:4-hydroxyacetophenone monooxygenase [Colletotrichum tofieldiae]|uniref:4-hydroxyacetophenone monooxygenase n=1 Tax=Colletotrichum tofieldiae TaxID=708197 RepID=A0A166U7R3_9PEZI|nr:4-hydroxyacetophenone monooxygenase [Colletotrichum tofieldiae]GKT89542.1 4-hydroxyacetophenone monooxygenase [Colletotrichum tofieldiae]